MTKYSVKSDTSSTTSFRGKKSNKILYIAIGSLVLLAGVAVAIAVPLSLKQDTVQTSLEEANQLLSENPVIDGHNDWPWQFRDNLQNVINNLSLHQDFTLLYNNSHTDIPRLRTGHVGAQFWACYVRCSSQQKDAVRQGLEQIDMIKRMVQADPDTFVFVTTADEIEAANKDKKIASMIGVEGGHMIDSSLAALRMLFDLGARYMTLTHSCPTPWAGNASSEMGLTDFGKLVVQEMNRLGMLVDLSHVSDQTMKDAINISKAPVIYSHSSARSLCDHPRNVPDEVLLQVKENNGIVMVNFYNDYVTCSPTANTSDVADHYDYIKNHIGVDFLGLGADYDGVTRVPTGLEDVSKYPNLIAELMRRNWTDEELVKIIRGNILRVMRATEAVARSLQETTDPQEAWIPQTAVQDVACRT